MTSFVEGRKVLALEVLDDRYLEGSLIVDLLDQGGYRILPGADGGPPSAFPGDQLVTAAYQRADQDWLENAVLSD